MKKRPSEENHRIIPQSLECTLDYKALLTNKLRRITSRDIKEHRFGRRTFIIELGRQHYRLVAAVGLGDRSPQAQSMGCAPG